MSEQSLPPRAPAAGRPRNPDVDRRILTAAREVFATAGWRNFSIEAVARRARVGKPSIYLRWQNKEDLLIQALESNITLYDSDPDAPLRDNLVRLAIWLLENFATFGGFALIRLRMDRDTPKGLQDMGRVISQAQIAAGRAIVKQGLMRGEISGKVSASLLLDALVGAVMNHAFSVTVYEGKVPLKSNEVYAEELVDFLLAGA